MHGIRLLGVGFPGDTVGLDDVVFRLAQHLIPLGVLATIDRLHWPGTSSTTLICTLWTRLSIQRLAEPGNRCLPNCHYRHDRLHSRRHSRYHGHHLAGLTDLVGLAAP
jgi:hypothetical protein